MLDLPDAAILDKARLIGGCRRLPASVDATRLAAEISRLPPSAWGSTAGRVGVHRAAEAIFLRGHAPAAGDLPIEDRPVASELPCPRRLIAELIDAPVQRCVLARLPPGATIAPHRDDGAPYFAKTIRIHVPIVSNELAFMLCDGSNYRMRPGEIWAIDNGAIHAVWNAHRTIERIHLICDYLPSGCLLDLLARGDQGLGRNIAAVDAHWASYLGEHASTTA